MDKPKLHEKGTKVYIILNVWGTATIQEGVIKDVRENDGLYTVSYTNIYDKKVTQTTYIVHLTRKSCLEALEEGRETLKSILKGI